MISSVVPHIHQTSAWTRLSDALLMRAISMAAWKRKIKYLVFYILLNKKEYQLKIDMFCDLAWTERGHHKDYSKCQRSSEEVY